MPDNYFETGKIMENEDCFTFYYAPGWGRYINGFKKFPLLDENKQDWINPGHEYIVFMSIANTCYYNDTDYFRMRQNGPSQSAVCMMFPIKNGMVYDPENEFGFGYNLDVNTWKSMIRAKIDWMKQ